jgi:hypothetical protein
MIVSDIIDAYWCNVPSYSGFVEIGRLLLEAQIVKGVS